MTPRVKDVIELLEEMAPTRLAESWDNPGLQVGFPSKEVHKIILALDPSMAAVRFASSSQAQVVVSHHPLIFKPMKAIDAELYPGNVVVEALRQGVSIIAAHTNLDASASGINAILAHLLDLKDVEVLEPASGEEDLGIGRIGTLSSPISVKEMALSVKTTFGIERVKVVGKSKYPITRVAVVGGSGGGFIRAAWLKGADALITGDLGYHHLREAEGLGLIVMDAGHFPTEKVAVDFFAGSLRKHINSRDWDVVLETFDQEQDPGYYI